MSDNNNFEGLIKINQQQFEKLIAEQQDNKKFNELITEQKGIKETTNDQLTNLIETLEDNQKASKKSSEELQLLIAGGGATEAVLLLP